MEVRNQTHGSGRSRIRSQGDESRHDLRQPANHLIAGQDFRRNIESRDRRGPAEGVRLPRKALLGGARATRTAPYLLRVRRSAESPSRQPMAAVSREIAEHDREFLAMCSLFREIAAVERAALIAHARIRMCAADESIFMMGSPGDSMAAVLSGRVRISAASPDGKEIVLAILAAGEIFGDIALLDGKERNTNARAVSECRLAILDRRDVQAFFERYPEARSCIVKTLCDRLRQTDQQITEMALLGLPVRLAKTLLRMAAIEPRGPNGSRSSHVRLTQREIGHLVGAARESVNKWLGGWQRKGLIRIAERLITIVDRPALEELAQLEPEANRELDHRQPAPSNGHALPFASY